MSSPILPSDTAQSLVRRDYRMAMVFRNHGIAYCCGGKWPLQLICETHGLPLEQLQAELQEATRQVQPTPLPDYAQWEIEFLVKYVVRVYHQYFRRRIPEIVQILAEFAEEHQKKLPYCQELVSAFDTLKEQFTDQLNHKELSIYPYITRIDNALKSDASYARLLVRTLRKSLADVQLGSEKLVGIYLAETRNASSHFTLPPHACTSHRVVFASLQELDQQLEEYRLIEKQVLFPRILQMEKQLLEEGL